ncbi:hypothetical protein BGX38DRAFT_1270131 [Terfezia claveryi]|nr:hypothetical protein BGX38DRAFT_1270131 [Terfezia claveryi]
MAATVSSRRPKLSLHISAQPSIPLQSIQQKPKPVLSVPISAVRNSRPCYSDLSDSEEDAKFWSGEEVSSATSSEDEDMMTSYHSKPSNGDMVVLPSPTCTSPFLPPASGMKFPTSSQRPGLTKLRLATALAPTASPVVGPNSRQKLSLAIPPPLPRRLGVLPSPIPPITAHPAPLKKSCLSSSLKPRKSVAFSSHPDVVISTCKYTLANSDLLEYLSSEECSEEELAETWGMTPEEGRMLGMPRGTVDRRERKWIGLINAFKKKSEGDDEE